MEDNIDKILSDKFANYKPAVPSHMWGSIEQNLSKRKKDRRGIILLFTGILSSAIIYAFMGASKASLHGYAVQRHPQDSGHSTAGATAAIVPSTKHISTTTNIYEQSSRAANVTPIGESILANEKAIKLKAEQASETNQGSYTYKKDRSVIALKHTKGLTSKGTTRIEAKLNKGSAEGLRAAVSTTTSDALQASAYTATSSSQSAMHLKNTAQGPAVVNGAQPLDNAEQSSQGADVALASAYAQDPKVGLEDTAQTEQTSLLPKPTEDDEKKKQASKPYPNDVQISLGLLKAWCGNDAVDKGYQIHLSYGRRVKGHLSTRVGLVFTTLGKPLHYEVPDDNNFGGAVIDKDPINKGLLDTSMLEKKPTPKDIVLKSATLLGLTWGLEYAWNIHKKWGLLAGCNFTPSLVLHTSNYYKGYDDAKERSNKMGTHGFRNLGLSGSNYMQLAYKPISRAQITAGLQCGYHLVSLHKDQRISPLMIGGAVGLKWLF